MKRRILGSVGLVYGIAVLLHTLLTGVDGPTVAHKVGAVLALVVAAGVIDYAARTISQPAR